jgi:hypothetical protein
MSHSHLDWSTYFAFVADALSKFGQRLMPKAAAIPAVNESRALGRSVEKSLLELPSCKYQASRGLAEREVPRPRRS